MRFEKQPYIGKKQHQLLGKLLVSRHPELAAEFLKQIPPIDTDLGKLPAFLTAFCACKGIEPEEFKGPLLVRSRVELRRIFVGAMVHIFTPQAYHLPPGIMFFTRGFTKALCEQLNINDSYTTRFIRQVVSDEKIYEDFRLQVEETVIMLNTKFA